MSPIIQTLPALSTAPLTIKNRVTGSLALAAYAYEVAKNYGITAALHTDHCAKQNIDSWVRLSSRSSVGQGCRRAPTFQPVDGSAIPTRT